MFLKVVRIYQFYKYVLVLSVEHSFLVLLRISSVVNCPNVSVLPNCFSVILMLLRCSSVVSYFPTVANMFYLRLFYACQIDFYDVTGLF